MEQTLTVPDSGASGGIAARPGPTPTDLATLMAAFNEVTGKLETTHVQLRGEVGRLTEELREANEALQRSKRLAALGEMAAGIAHEIRNPLGSIGLYARMLTEDLEEQPEHCARAEKIAAAVRRLNEIVCDVLAFSKELRAQAMTSEASELFEQAIESCCVSERISVRIVGGDTALCCDPTLMHQALVNLVRNAVDAMEDAGGPADHMLEAEASMRIDSDTGRRVAVLRICDSGPGVPADVIERMFNPFFTTRAAGTGLGLAIVNRIADAHGGWIEVRNNGHAGRAEYAAKPVRGGVAGGSFADAAAGHVIEQKPGGARGAHRADGRGAGTTV
ncbi:MAG: ATP-binding protein [Planctomycetota bacterium]